MKAPPTESRAALMLVVVTLVWGISFSWTRTWQLAAAETLENELLSGLTLIALRMPLALIILGVWQPRVILAPTRREYVGGAVLGAVFFAGFALQTWALAATTPALSAFFTSLCSAWVPIIAWLVLGRRTALVTLGGLAMGLLGCGFLVEGGWRLGWGEWLTLIASVLFAGQVLVLDSLGKRMNPSHLSAGFMAATGTLALVGAVIVAALGPGIGDWSAWTLGMIQRGDIWPGVVYLALFCTALGFHWMNSYQPFVSPVRASLIYLLEPVFSSIVSVWWGYDDLTLPLLAGGGLILVGNLLAELPRLLVARRHVEQENDATAA